MALVFLSVSTLLIVLTNVNDATPAPTIRIQDILSCGITYDDFNTIDGWTKSDFETSYLSGSQKYHGFWDGSPTNGFTKLTREYKTTTTTEITIYFTFIWGCTADYVGTINNNIAMSDYGIVDIDIVNGYNGNIKNVTHLLAINTTLGYSNFPTYGYTDPLLWNIPFCDSSLLTDWREHGKIMDGFITFSINANQIFEVDFAVTMTDEKPDEFWGVTNIAIVGHACSKSLHSQITINNIWIDDLVYDNINGWSLPNLVLWNDANNGNKYHGWFYHDIIQQTLSLNRTFFCNQKANINVTFRYIFAGHWDETYYVNVFIDNNLKQTFNLNSSDNIHYPRVTDEFVTTYIDYRSTGYFTAYEYRVIIDDIIVDAYQDFTVSINTFLGNRIGYRAFWGIADFEIRPSIPLTDTPTTLPTFAPVTIIQPTAAPTVNSITPTKSPTTLSPIIIIPATYKPTHTDGQVDESITSTTTSTPLSSKHKDDNSNLIIYLLIIIVLLICCFGFGFLLLWKKKNSNVKQNQIHDAIPAIEPNMKVIPSQSHNTYVNSNNVELVHLEIVEENNYNEDEESSAGHQLYSNYRTVGVSDEDDDEKQIEGD
eukprot:320929_1